MLKKIAFWSFVILLSGCDYYHTKDEDVAAVGGVTPSFAELNAKIFTPRCVQCHVQYGDYKFVKQELNAIQRAVKENRMPKSSPPLSGTLKALLNQWVAGGAPNEADSVSEPQPDTSDKLVATWNSLYTKIFLPKCVICHSPSGEAKWIDLSNRIGMTKTLLEHINFEKPDESYLVERLRDPEEPMPPPPPQSNIPRLTDEEIKVVIEWIAAGLP